VANSVRVGKNVGMTRRAQIAALAAVLVAAPTGYAGWNELHLRSGRHVLLQAHPVDPHDPFRGEYVALAYRESRPPAGATEGQLLYVPLHRGDDGVWVGARPTPERPARGIFLRGRVDGWQIRFGLERFYVREGTARAYEDAMHQDRLYADVVVQDDGGAQLDDLVIR